MKLRYWILIATIALVGATPGWIALWQLGHGQKVHAFGASENFAVPIGPAGVGDGGPANQLNGTYSNPGVAALPTVAQTPGTCPVWGSDGKLTGSTTCGGADGSVPVAQYAPALYNNGTSTYLVDITGPTDGGPVSIPATGAHLDLTADAAFVVTQDPAVVAGNGADMTTYLQAPLTDGGPGHIAYRFPAPVGLGGNGDIRLYYTDGGSPAAQLAVTGPTGGGLCFGSIAGTNCTATNAVVWSDGNNGVVQFNAATGDSDSQFIFTATNGSGAHNVLAMNGNGWSIGDPAIQWLNNLTALSFGPQHATTDTATVATQFYGQDAFLSASTNTSGGSWLGCGGASTLNGTTGTMGFVGFGLGGGDHSDTGAPNACASKIGIQLSPLDATGRFAVCLGQGGSGCTSTNIPSGSGVTWFGNAATNPTSAPIGGPECWGDHSTGALTCWNPGAGASFVVGSGGGGGCAIAGDLTGACGANTLTSITGNGSAVVGVTANVFNYTNGGTLEWTSNGAALFQATGGNVTVNSSSGIAYLTGNVTSVQSAAASSLSAGTSITETAGTTFAAIAGGTTLSLSGVNSSLSGGTGGLNMSAAANVSLTSTGTGSAALIATGGNVLVSAGGTALFGATGQVSLSSSSSVYVNAGAGQYQHLQIGGVDQITLESDGNVNLASAPLVTVPAPNPGQYCPKPAVAFTMKVDGILRTFIGY